MRTLGLIPARGGSKRLPGKNVAWVAGKPLIFWTIEAAMHSRLDEVWVSTEDADIREICRDSVKVVHRPAELATDLASMESVLQDLAKHARGFERIMLLQPTSPLRTAAHIDAALWLDLPCVSVFEFEPMRYERNGAIYLMDSDRLMHFEAAFPIMTADESVDIDTMEDLERAEALLT